VYQIYITNSMKDFKKKMHCKDAILFKMFWRDTINHRKEL